MDRLLALSPGKVTALSLAVESLKEPSLSPPLSGIAFRGPIPSSLLKMTWSMIDDVSLQVIRQKGQGNNTFSFSETLGIPGEFLLLLRMHCIKLTKSWIPKGPYSSYES